MKNKPIYEVDNEESSSLKQVLYYMDRDNPCIFKNDELLIDVQLNELPFCCGVVEMGGLSMDESITQREFNIIMEAIIIMYKGNTIIINTNGIDDSVMFEHHLSKCKLFKVVKSFKNSNSDRMVTIWVSK